MISEHKPSAPVRASKTIRAGALRTGDKIVLTQAPDGTPKRTKDVTRVEECPQRWRNYIHVNKSECYWAEAAVTVIV